MELTRSFITRATLLLSILVSSMGCQPQAAGQRTSLFDMTKPPRLFNGSGDSIFAQNSTGPSIFSAFRNPNATGQNPNGTGNWFGNWNPNAQNPGELAQQNQWFQGLSEQVKSLNQRLGQFDSDNQQMLTEIAGLKQRLQAAGDYNYQLKQQLADSIGQLQLLQNDKRNLEQQLANWQMRGNASASPVSGNNAVPAQPIGTAVLRANNSLLQKLPQLQIEGASARMDGDVIRVEMPTDRLFAANSFQLNPQTTVVLQQLAAAVQREFPRQIIGIEAHWDGTPLSPGNTAHQVTSTQALAVFDFLQRLGLTEKQLFTMAMGNNRPYHPPGVINGISPNRRIEIVVYPETFDGK
jgi:flagellar motor protein MotB